MCQTQLLEAIALGKRGQVVLLHGEVNAVSVNNASALELDFNFSLAAFLVAASPTAFFGYSQGWYYSGTRWHEEYDRRLGAPVALAKQGTGHDNMTWTRTFESGTSVELDVLHHTATISWR